MSIHGRSRFAAVALISLALSCFAAFAENTFEAELGSDPAKVQDDVKISMMNGDNEGMESGKGLVPHLKTLGAPPKRIGLVSFYVWDCGNKKESSYNIYGGDYVYHVRNTRTRSVDSDEVDRLATELHDAGLDSLKESFAEVGMQLLTPEEFLDTDAKRDLYAQFQPEVGGMSKFLSRLQKRNNTTWQWGAPDGYRILELVTVGDVKGNHFQLGMTGIGIGKFANAVGSDLTKALGLDAVVILYNVVQAEPKDIRMRGAGLYMFGPNPIANKGQGMYWPGQEYSGVYLRMDVPFITTDKKGMLIDADYKGYAIVAKALGSKMAKHVKGKTG